MASARREALKKHANLLLDQLHPDTDIPSIMLSIGLDMNERHYVMAEAGMNRKMRFFDLLSLSVGDIDNWLKLIAYLQQNDKNAEIVSHLTSTLATANEQWLRGDQSVLDTFSYHLARFYRSRYGEVRTLYRTSKHVRDTWVPLIIQNQTESYSRQHRVTPDALIQRLLNSCDGSTAVVKGDPWTGKTTLVKKVSYDWALRYGNNDTANTFKLILAVPLRAAGKFDSFDQLALDYYLTALKLGGFAEDETVKLRKIVSGLESDLLVILDGLDEYGRYAESPFEQMFGPKFDLSASHCRLPPPYFLHKLIVTSRPYACANISPDFSPLHFEVVSIDPDYLADYARRYCQTEAGTASMLQYLDNSEYPVIEEPLILMCICYLADRNELSVPINLTLLYELFLKEKLSRSEQLVEQLDLKNWKLSAVVKRTAQLAWLGKTENESLLKLTFDPEALQRCQVSNDSFTCGFLSYKYDSEQESLIAEFSHPSIQDYFAALYCYRCFVDDIKDTKADILEAVWNRGFHMDRFLFGICSIEQKVFELLDWLQLRFDDLTYFESGTWSSYWEVHNVSYIIYTIAIRVSDCSAMYQYRIGRCCLAAIDKMKETLMRKWKRRTPVECLDTSGVSEHFLKGINLGILRGSANDKIIGWRIDADEQPRLAKCLLLTSELLADNCDQIQLLMWTGKLAALDKYFLKKDSFPPIQSLVIRTEGEFAQVTFILRYAESSAQIRLQGFRFIYGEDERQKLIDLTDRFDTEMFKISKRKQADLGRDSSDRSVCLCLDVAISTNAPRSALIGSMIKLAVNWISNDPANTDSDSC